jgi:hypothetical protein
MSDRSPARPVRVVAALADRLLRLAVVLGLIVASPGGLSFVSAQVASISVDEAAAEAEAFFAPLEEVVSRIDRTTFDVDELAFELAFEDAPTIVAYVRDELAFEPYAGILRGAQGTLASGAGNAWDLALLTARLLADAGYEVEVRRATLDDAQVEALLAGVEAVPPVQDAVAEEVGAAIDPFDPEGGREALEAALVELRAEVDAIDARLPDVGPDAGATALERVRASQRDYAWVAYRLGDEPWSEAHPALPEGATFDLEAETAYDAELPAEVQHRFRYQVFVERKLGDRLEAQPVTEAWERPTANLYGVPLNFVNLPDGVEGAPADAAPADLLDRTSFLFPTTDGDIAPGGQAFDMSGAVVPMEAAASPFAGVFQTVGDSVGQAAGALGGLGIGGSEEPEEAVALTAQWIEFTMIAPGGEETVHRRYVVDRVGPDARAEGRADLRDDVSELDAFEALMSSRTFMLDPGRYRPAYVSFTVAEAVLAQRDQLEAALLASYGGPAPSPPDPETLRAKAVIAPLSLLSVFADATGDPAAVSYRPAAGLVVLSQRLDATRPMVDVVANPRWSLTLAADGPAYDAAATRRAGVWETRAEALVLAQRGVPTVPAIAALDQPSLTRFGPGDADAVRATDLPEASRAAIVRDLQRGYTVLAPTRLDDGATVAGWWRVDPTTGETLGRGADGRGNAALEYVTTLELAGSILAATYFTIDGVQSCLEIEDDAKAGCCIVQNIALAGVGFAGGMLLGMALGLSAVAGFVVLDIGGGYASSLIPPVCGT